MNIVQRIENYINGELQLIADELRQQIVDNQYDELIEDLVLQEQQMEQWAHDYYYEYESEWD